MQLLTKPYGKSMIDIPVLADILASNDTSLVADTALTEKLKTFSCTFLLFLNNPVTRLWIPVALAEMAVEIP